MNTTASRAAWRLDPHPKTASPVATPRLPEPSGLTPDEIRQIVLDIIG